MRKYRALKTTLYLVSAAFILSISTSTAHAENSVPMEQGIAGISESLDNLVAVKGNNAGAADKTIINILKTEIISPYSNMGVSIADNYVNVRSKPTIDSEVVGKLYKGCAADILEHLDGDWVKIKSGDVEGYIAKNFLAIGKEAETMIDKYATKYATVNTATLNVRENKSIDSKIYTQIPQGENYIITKEYDGWAEILLGGTDESTGEDFTGFVSKDYITIRVEFKHAISIEEENRIKKAQEEAERAEEERKATQIAEVAAKKAEEKRRAEEANNSSQESNHSDSFPSTNSSSALNKIITYALKFVGNSYVWGGTSLTRGADCSGFVQAIYSDFGYYIPRVSRDQARYAGKEVSEGDRRPGDLIFYTNSNGTVNHVAMYIGSNKIVQAANSRQGIIVSQYNYRSVYRIRRIID